MGASHRPPNRLPKDLQSPQAHHTPQRIRMRTSISLSVRYLARPSWGREREVHPAARWLNPPVEPICYLKAYSRESAHDGRHGG